jgi:hypothetical protein
MKLQETYKPEDYYEIIKGDVPISYGTLLLICNHFDKLNKEDKKKLKAKLLTTEIFYENKKRYQKYIDTEEEMRLKKELEIIEIFQRNNI